MIEASFDGLYGLICGDNIFHKGIIYFISVSFKRLLIIIESFKYYYCFVLLPPTVDYCFVLLPPTVHYCFVLLPPTVGSLEI